MQTVQEAHLARIGVFGGSFNPVHQGHIELIEAALRSGLDHVFAIPAARSPFKGEQLLLPARLRFEMLRASLAGAARVSVLDLELRRPPPSYTVDTIEALAAWLPEARLSLLLGADAFEGFAEWRHAARILARAELILFARAGAPGDAQAASGSGIARLPEPYRAKAHRAEDGSLRDENGNVLVRFISSPIAPLSSTRIRRSGTLEDVPPGARELLQAHLAAQAR